MTNPAPPDALTALLEATARLVQAHEQLVQANQQQSHKIDALTEQIGQLSAVITLGFSETKAGLSGFDLRLDRLATSTERQEQNIYRLAATVERQASLVEWLLERERPSS